jgi:predicted dehydrogenase
VRRLGVGLIGCGTISTRYLLNGPRFGSFRFVACADADPAAAERAARAHGIEACDVDTLLARPDVEAVLCLTPPDSHADVALQALAAGKHVHTEKPLATSVEDGRRVLAAAAAAGLRVGAAPDTFLGAGMETMRAALEEGAVGVPAVAEVHLLAGPPEAWHPSPGFLYAELGGPLLDLGPYAVTTAVSLLGPVRRVAALAAAPRTEGRIATGPRAGSTFPILEPTRVAAVLEHDGGVLCTLTATYDADGPAQHGVVVHGREGTLLGGDPNAFDGPVVLRRRGEGEEVLPLVSEWRDESRGLGLDDLCRAAAGGGEQRASGALALHVLEVLMGVRAVASGGPPPSIAPPPRASGAPVLIPAPLMPSPPR